LKKSLLFWGEKYLFSPGVLEWFLALLLLPFSLLYCLIVWSKFKLAKVEDFGIPIVSVGNLIVGGSGKTPLTVALAKQYSKPAIILRGYGRKSKGMQIVSHEKEILCDVKCSGDEAMLYATLLPHALVIVAEDRVEGILKAKEIGVDLIFLDDAYSKHFIKKLDLLIYTKQENPFCLPSGPFRERLWTGKKAVEVEENIDFKRQVSILEESPKMALVTAISKPQRLDAYLNENVIEKVYFPDHHAFTKQELQKVLNETKATSLLVTRKDAVKMQEFNLPLSYLELELKLDESLHQTVLDYVKIAH